MSGQRYGVILAMDVNTNADAADYVHRLLADRFPGVTFAIVGGCTSSVAFPLPEEDER